MIGRSRYLLLAALLLMCRVLLAQAGSAELTGLVEDSSGAAVVGAHITVKDVETGITSSTLTGTDGLYSLPGLRPGVYQMEVEANGFSHFLRNGVTLRTGDRARVDATLRPGKAAETVTVTADAPLLQSESGSLRQIITEEKISQIPLNGRTFVQLATLAPGVALPPNSPLPRINGGRPRTNEYLFDGVTSLLPEPGQVVFFPVIDAIQEFDVESNSVPAQFGRFNGGVVNLTTKSGTNQFHGTAFEFLRNEALNARNFFTPSTSPKPEFRRNQFGETFGGPVLRNRTFFFMDYQGTRQAIANPKISTVPTLAQRQGDFSDPTNPAKQIIYDPATTASNGTGGFTRTGFTNNQIPLSRMDPAALELLNRYPLPNRTGTATGANNFILLGTDQDNQDQFDSRIDHKFSERDQVFVRYSWFHEFGNPAAFFQDGSGGTGAADTLGQQVAGNYVHTFNERLLNEARFGYTRRGVTRRGVALDSSIQQSFGIPGIPATNSFADGLPVIQISGLQQLGAPTSTNLDSRTDVTEFVDNVSLIRGRHSLKLGADLRWERLDILQPPNPTGSFSFTQLFTDLPGTTGTGNAVASFLLGQVQQFQIDLESKPFRERAHIFESYIQDDWKATRRLTVNAGLRYTLNFPSTEVDNQGAVFNLQTQKLDYLGQSGFSSSARELHPLNFGPRVGLAYQLFQNTVVRAGYGLVWIEQAGITTPFTTPQFPFLQTVGQRTLDNINPAFLLSNGPSVAPIPLTPDAGLGQGVFAVNRDLGSGYVQQWNLAVQHQLTNNISFQFAYAGSHIVHVGMPDVNINQLTPDQLALGNTLLQKVANPFFGKVPASSSIGGPTISRAQLLMPFPEFTAVALYRNNIGDSHYHAFEAKLEQRLSHGMSYLVSYTHSKLIDEASSVFDASVLTGPIANFPVANSFNVAGEKDSSSGDIPNVLVASYMWTLPVRVHNWAGALLNGWQVAGTIDLQSGMPVAITQATNFNAFAGYGVQRPNVTGPPNLSPDQRTPSHFFNTAAFVAAPQFTLGNSSRNPVRGPAYRDADIAFIKTVNVRERVQAQLRAEIFDLTNTPAFAQPNGVLGNPAFGSITSTVADPRVVQLGLKLSF